MEKKIENMNGLKTHFIGSHLIESSLVLVQNRNDKIQFAKIVQVL